MGLLRELTTEAARGTASDAAPLRDLISAVVNADGSVDLAEHLSVEALYETVPQLREAGHGNAPPRSRKTVIASLAKIEDEHLRRQLFVIALDLALSSEGATEGEDAFVTELQAALGIDEDFARAAIIVLSFKYARAR